jgi:hypothetical protein
VNVGCAGDVLPAVDDTVPLLGCGGDDGTRTHDPLLAKQVLFQLSYIPMLTCGFGLHCTPSTVARRSNGTITAAQDRMAWAPPRRAVGTTHSWIHLDRNEV